MISTEKKQKYLLEKWGFVEIERAVIDVPVFDKDGNFLMQYKKEPAGVYCCRNYSLDWDNVDKCYLMRDEYKDPFWGEVKEFYSLSVEEAIDLAYKSERIGEQLNLFVEV